MILQYFESQKVDLIITNGTPCIVAASQTIKNIPVVYTVAFSPKQLGMITPDNITGVYDPVDINYVLEKTKLIIPGIKKIGLVYNTAEPNATYAASKIIQATKEMNIVLETLGVESTSDLIQATNVLVQKGVDLIISSADNRFNASLEAISNITTKKKIPIVITDPSNTDKGALLGIGIDYSDWGYQSGIIASQVIRGKSVKEIPEKTMTDFKFYLNMKIANQISLPISDEVKESADIIYN